MSMEAAQKYPNPDNLMNAIEYISQQQKNNDESKHNHDVTKENEANRSMENDLTQQQWACEKCTFLQNATNSECMICGNLSSVYLEQLKREREIANYKKSHFDFQKGDLKDYNPCNLWPCSCGLENDSYFERCDCGEPRPKSALCATRIMSVAPITLNDNVDAKYDESDQKQVPFQSNINMNVTLNSYIDLQQSDIENIDSNNSTISKEAFFKNNNGDDACIVSMENKGLLIAVSFDKKLSVQLNSIIFHASSNVNLNTNKISAPKSVYIYNNKISNIKFRAATKKIMCSTYELNHGQTVMLNNCNNSNQDNKFKRTECLTIQIKSNQNNTKQVYLSAIEFRGVIKHEIETINSTD
eukprot:526004_1